jgi:hypothetical protein
MRRFHLALGVRMRRRLRRRDVNEILWERVTADQQVEEISQTWPSMNYQPTSCGSILVRGETKVSATVSGFRCSQERRPFRWVCIRAHEAALDVQPIADGARSKRLPTGSWNACRIRLTQP